jgi:hypothetical protein
LHLNDDLRFSVLVDARFGFAKQFRVTGRPVFPLTTPGRRRPKNRRGDSASTEKRASIHVVQQTAFQTFCELKHLMKMGRAGTVRVRRPRRVPAAQSSARGLMATAGDQLGILRHYQSKELGARRSGDAYAEHRSLL